MTSGRDPNDSSSREYEQSGMYPRHGKPFRLGTLLLGLTAVIIMLALTSAVLDWILDY